MANPTKDQLKTLLAIEAQNDPASCQICQQVLEDCEAMGWIEFSDDFHYILAQEGREVLFMMRA